MSFGDTLASLGKLNAVVCTAISTVVCALAIYEIIRGKDQNGNDIPRDLKGMSIAAIVFIAAMSWFVLWLCDNYKIVAQISGVALIASLIHIAIYGVPPQIKIYLGW